MDARDVVAALYAHYASRYAVLTEITTCDEEVKAARAARARGGAQAPAVDRRCDVLLIGKDERIAVEVKVSRADFLTDVARPEKQAAWRRVTHRFAYAAPAGLIRPDEVPAGTGLLEVGYPAGRHGRRPVVWGVRVRRDPTRVVEPLPPRVLSTVCHRMARAEAQLRGYGWGSPEGSVEELRARVSVLQRELDKQGSELHRAREALADWRRAWGQVATVLCASCGKPIRPQAGGRRADVWVHRRSADGAGCEAAREADAARRRLAGDRFAWPAPVAPADDAPAAPFLDAHPASVAPRAVGEAV